MKIRKLITHLSALALLSTLAAPLLQAEEDYWVYTKGADTREKGSFEAELANISRIGKDSGHYIFHDIRPELEYGITDKLSIAAELMIFHHNFGGIPFDPYGDEAAQPNFRSTQFAGYAFTLKYNVLNPYEDAFGLSLGFAFEHNDRFRLDGSKIDQDAFVPILYLQKGFMDDDITLAFNGKFPFERRKGSNSLEEEIGVELTTAAAYRLTEKWVVGFEFRFQADFVNPQDDGEFQPGRDRSSLDLSDIRLGSNFQHAVYGGPSIHYDEEEWWATLGFLYQIYGTGDLPEANQQNLNQDEQERVHIGVSFGYEF